MKEENLVLLKAPQVIIARKLRREAGVGENGYAKGDGGSK